MFIVEEDGIKKRLIISGKNGRRVYAPLKDGGASWGERKVEESFPNRRDVVPRVTRAVRNGGTAVISASKVLGAVIQRGETVRVGETAAASLKVAEEKAEVEKPPEPEPKPELQPNEETAEEEDLFPSGAAEKVFVLSGADGGSKRKRKRRRRLEAKRNEEGEVS